MAIPSIILFLPLVVATLILVGVKRSATVSAYLSTASAAVTLLLSFILLGSDDTDAALLSWISAGDLSLDIGFKIDQLSRGMMVVVTLIGTLVHVFSLGYMKDDDGKARYFAGLSLFMFSMTGIVLANNFPMMFIFWELVGVSSYILIGHWFTKNSAADAAKKAFLTNRIGDFGFMIGILLLWGLTGSVSFSGIEENLPAAVAAYPGFITAAALCIFCGAVGKSAQLPLHVWLPDAMEGPTPVSALIHAATMVAAGVFMLVRVDFLVGASVTAAEVIAWVGGITSLVAALMATQQNDIKKILAYSTLSQLGYMVMAVGLLSGESAMFHLFTHASFKALLFLGSGAVIYACHHEQNIWKMGGLMKKMPITFWTFAIGTAALIAVPGTSGFWSKESILAAAHNPETGNPALFWIAVGVAFLTTFYMLRLVIVAFLGKGRTDNADHAKEVAPLMSAPLCVLAFFAIFAGYGFVYGPLQALHPEGHEFHLDIVFFASIGSLILGSAAAFFLYNGRDKDPISLPLFANKFYLDEIYQKAIDWIQGGLAALSDFLDEYLVGGLFVKGGSGLTAGVGNLLRRLQGGNLHIYALFFGLGVVILIYLTVFAV